MHLAVTALYAVSFAIKPCFARGSSYILWPVSTTHSQIASCVLPRTLEWGMAHAGLKGYVYAPLNTPTLVSETVEHTCLCCCSVQPKDELHVIVECTAYSI